MGMPIKKNITAKIAGNGLTNIKTIKTEANKEMRYEIFL